MTSPTNNHPAGASRTAPGAAIFSATRMLGGSALEKDEHVTYRLARYPALRVLHSGSRAVMCGDSCGERKRVLATSLDAYQ